MKTKQFKWLVATIMLVAAMVVPSTTWAQTMYTVFDTATGTLTFKYADSQPESTDTQKVYDVPTSSSKPGWTDKHSSDIKTVVFDASFANARPTLCNSWFNNCKNLTNIQDIKNLNTSEVTEMAFMFVGCEQLTTLDLSYFDTSNVKLMSNMFCGCVNLTTIYVSNNFTTNKVQSSDDMFAFCTSLVGIIAYDDGTRDKTYANYQNGYFTAVPYVVINGSYLYFKCDGSVKPDDAYSLNEGTETPGWSDKASEINVVQFDESFKYIRPTSCYKWFSGCSSLKAIDCTSLNTSRVTNMSEMFKDCSRLTQIKVSNLFTTDNVQSSNDMFAGCTSLEGIIACDGINNIDKTYANFTNGYLLAVPYAILSDGVLTFKCDGAKQNGGNALRDDELQHWYFSDLYSITKVVFDESFKNARPTSCLDWFLDCKNLNTIEGIENFNTSKVTNMREMFKHCYGLKSLDLTNFDTKNVMDMGLMFYECPALSTIYVSDKFTLDKVQSSEDMFAGCTSLSGAIACDGTNNIDGTYANYYSGYFTCGIKTAADLASFDECVNTEGKEGGTAVLLNDITMTAEDNFSPITSNYTGKFDGRGHTIGGLNFSESNNCLFANNCGTIKNLGVVNATIAEGSNGSICNENSGTIESCFFMGTTKDTTTPNGAVCQTNSGTITNCYYLASNDDSNGGKTEAQFKGGEVCYLMNNGITDGTQTWYQNIDNDAYPVFDSSHATVYASAPCPIFSNSEGETAEHSYPTEFDSNGFMKCSHCEATQYQPATQNTNNVYEIGNAGQLYWFAGLVDGDESVCDYDADSNPDGTEQNTSACAILTADITVNTGDVANCGGTKAVGWEEWTPIGNYGNKYYGTFDGNGKTINGLYFNNASIDVGLFGYVSGGTIKNVGVVNSYFKGDENVGGVCGLEAGGIIQNCYNAGTVEGKRKVGGICGLTQALMSSTLISCCHNTGTVRGTDNVGGVCGENTSHAQDYPAKIENCYNTGSVSGTTNIGGVCGQNASFTYGNATITNCHNTSSVSGSGYVGGICGYNQTGDNGATSIIYHCYYDNVKYTGDAVGGNESGTVGEDVMGKTTAQFNSGEVCYLLNGSSPYGEWGQQIGTDDYPVPGSDYKVIRAAQNGQNGTNYWATFSNLDSNAELTASNGEITVYNATVSGGTLTLAKRSDSQVAAGEGVLLKANSEYVNAMNISEDVTAAVTGENDLLATPATAQTISAETGYTLYRLTYNKTATMEGLGFYLGVVGESKDGSQLKATPGKAYLNVLTSEAKLQSSAAPARGFAFPGDGETSGIECITVTDEELHKNDNAEGIFDLQGRKVSKPAKGVYINNGKKVIIK